MSEMHLNKNCAPATTKVKVFLEDGIVQTVMTNDPGVEVEIVDFDRWRGSVKRPEEAYATARREGLRDHNNFFIEHCEEAEED